jgi:uncharacterized membrane protein YphA (DoxX/SURF4 family)
MSLGVVFLTSGSLKLYSPQTFRILVKHFIPSPNLAYIISVLIPSIEILLGFFLFVGLLTRFATIHTDVLLIFFLFITVYGIKTRVKLNCGCFGDLLKTTFGAKNLILQAVLSVFAFFIVLDRERAFSLDKFIQRRMLRK